MGFGKQVVHSIHLTAFAFLGGNLLMDFLFGKRKYEASQYPLLSRYYTIAWLSIIVTGIVQIILVSKQGRYVNDSKFSKWIKILLFKTILTFFAAFGVELIVKLAIPEANRREILKIVRVILFLVLFYISGYSREFREIELKSEPEKKKS